MASVDARGRPEIEKVFGDSRLGGDARELLLKPGFERQHQRPALFLPHHAAIAGAAAPDRLLDRIEGRDALESLAGDRSGAALGDVEESASQMGPTKGERDSIQNDSDLSQGRREHLQAHLVRQSE
jgi:hypothetical protein